MVNKRVFGYLAVSALIFFTGFQFSSYLNPLNQKTNIAEPKTELAPTPSTKKQNPIDFLTFIETPKGPLQVKTTTDAIYIESPEVFESINPTFKHNFVINKAKYPKLFEQGVANGSFVITKVVPMSGGKFAVEISNNQPYRGFYSPYYVLIIDPITGEVTENTHPHRDTNLTVKEIQYLENYPHISDLIGNDDIWELKTSKLNVNGLKLESLITVPITASSWQRLYVFDKDANYIEEKGYEMQVKKAGDTIEVSFMPNFSGLGQDIVIVKVYGVDSKTKKIAIIKEYQK